jgi:hypothetical protein
MNVINMLADYKVLVEKAQVSGRFPAYQDYVGKYPELFNNVLKYLYLSELDDIRPMIEQTDFGALLRNGEKNIAAGQTDAIVTQVQAVAERLGFDPAFDLYLGLELGNIGGCSMKANTPFLYIGIDRPLTAIFLKYYIPHEFNHMVRIAALPEIDMFDFKERTLTEGLGSYAPIAHYDLPYNSETISAALSLPQDEVQTLLARFEEIQNSVSAHFGELLNPELMATYFNMGTDEDGELTLGGYFVGLQVVHRLVESGLDFKALTEMPGDEIWRVYRAID